MGVHGGVECCAGNYGGRHYKTVVGKVCSHCDCRRLVGCGVGRHCGGAMVVVVVGRIALLSMIMIVVILFVMGRCLGFGF